MNVSKIMAESGYCLVLTHLEPALYYTTAPLVPPSQLSYETIYTQSGRRAAIADALKLRRRRLRIYAFCSGAISLYGLSLSSGWYIRNMPIPTNKATTQPTRTTKT